MNFMFDNLLPHVGHKISCVIYGDMNDPNDVCIECEDCNEVLVSAESFCEVDAIPDQWISVKDRLPEKNGEYLVVCRGVVTRDYISMCKFNHNLHAVDEFDFPVENRPGWYNYDGEHGYYEVAGVKYWMPLPEMPEV